MSTVPLPPAERTIPAMLAAMARRHGDRPVFAAGDTRWTVAGALDAAAGRGAALLAAGIRRGDRVAILCGNRAEVLETVLGCGWIGAVAVPINSAAQGPQLGYYLRNSGARLLVAEAGFLPRLAFAGDEPLPLERIWVLGGGADHPLAQPFPPPGPAAEPADVTPGEPFAILYTSGTTGPSKGVLCPHAQYYWWGVNTAALLEVGPEDVLVTTLPLFHINALNSFAQALLTGARMVLEPKFSASGFWPSMIEAGATVVYLLGAMVPILLSRPAGAAERAHRVRVGLGPGVPPDLIRAFRERTGVPLLEGYGSTETNFVIGATAAEQRPGSIGRVRPGFHARVVDEQDAELPAGEAGELVLRADEPFAFSTGYFGMPDKTVEAWRNLWFHTGDRVVREADGGFRFVDRLKDAIRRRGENISSHEVEQVLLSHPAIATAAVFPVRSELAEDEVMAAIVPKPGEELDPVALMKFCEPRLPHFAIPRFVEVMEELPRTENGKVQKFRLRERGRTAATWDREAAGYVVRRS
ncbi:ATP-dependent acyl-CoA ligase [Azospirillum thermophilum]|uniref:ATP-dependent acyl-CoA ligase n=1 Tax=Azospirillum thermophilum TaxID=2202148 RepID=A0A2S2D034_9PROT|nr:ATP-dependent acyl-CoA ligase [Azospirillum thermophilum]AWK90122.1 ATP-dependent acyl-CoA ligase [Azospirillum thermophilum]